MRENHRTIKIGIGKLEKYFFVYNFTTMKRLDRNMPHIYFIISDER